MAQSRSLTDYPECISEQSRADTSLHRLSQIQYNARLYYPAPSPMDDLTTSLQWQQLQNYLNVGVSALYIYEYGLTFQWQLRCFWTRRFSHVSLMLYLNCYLNCAVCVMTIVGLPGVIDDILGCKVWFYTGWALSMLNMINFQALYAIRLYAISSQRQWFVVPVVATALIAVSMNVVVYFRHVTFTVEPFFGCNSAIRISDTLDLKLSYVNKIALVLSECWAIATVSIVMYPYIRQHRQAQMAISPTIKIIIEDTFLSFLTMLLMSTLDLFYLKYFKLNNPLPTAFDLINAILIADLLYKLRSVNDTSPSSASTTLGTVAAYRDHPINMTLGTPSVDDDNIAAIKATLPPPPEGHALFSDIPEDDASFDAHTIGDRSSIFGTNILQHREEGAGSMPRSECDITDEVQWGGPLRPISSFDTQSHCSMFTNNFLPV